MVIAIKMNDDTDVLAIDIGGSSTKLALVNRLGKIKNWQSFPTSAANGPAFVDKILVASRLLLADAANPITGAAVAIAGFVSADGALDFNANLPWLEGAPISRHLSAGLGLPVKADCDSNAACLAEYIFGQGQGAGRFLCLTGGTGLGVGMMVGGKLLRVAHGCMGDAGHVIVSPNGPECSCGGHGCAEALLSTETLARRYAGMINRSAIDFRNLVADAQTGVPEACELLEEAGRWLGIAAASLASIFLPDRIAVAGGLSHAGNNFMAAAQNSFDQHAGRLPLSRASLVRATTGEHATLLGAAASIFYPEHL
jgi:glucokinase